MCLPRPVPSDLVGHGDSIGECYIDLLVCSLTEGKIGDMVVF